MERVFMTIEKYGNTSASSLGIALDELLKQKDVAHGENILLTAFGAGIDLGFIYSYKGKSSWITN
jgi:3-oxoacyl-[acyl-carrier-protein] synthase-3